MQTNFFLKLAASLVPEHITDEIARFCKEVHETKMNIVCGALRDQISDVKKTVATVRLVDAAIGCDEKLLTSYKRQQLFESSYNFIEPQRILLEAPDKDATAFFYQSPIAETLVRLCENKYLRSNVIHSGVLNDSGIYRNFDDGSLVKTMEIQGPTIFIRCYQAYFLFQYMKHVLIQNNPKKV